MSQHDFPIKRIFYLGAAAFSAIGVLSGCTYCGPPLVVLAFLPIVRFESFYAHLVDALVATETLQTIQMYARGK